MTEQSTIPGLFCFFIVFVSRACLRLFSLFCSIAPFSLYLIFSALRLPRITFHPYFLTTLIQPHTLSHVTPRLAFIPFFPISLFPVG